MAPEGTIHSAAIVQQADAFKGCILRRVERRLPPQYTGWEGQRAALRRKRTAELILDVQDGPPERRLAALSVIDLGEVPVATIEDWIATLPETEANELAGAIPVRRAYSTCTDEVRWARVARAGFARRRLPTFLVMLFHALEALEARGCAESPIAWEETGDWLGETYAGLSAKGDHVALEDITLFVFENYLDRDAIFETFCSLAANDRALALKVSANPTLFLGSLERARQQVALQEAERGGGLPAREAWKRLQGLA